MFLRSFTKKNCRFIWLDLETTGFNIFHNSIIEIAAMDSDGNEFSTLVRYLRPLPKKIIKITGITDEMLGGQPDIESALRAFLEFMKDNNKTDKKRVTYIVGHNLYGFDLPFLKAQCKKYGLKFPKCNKLDTLRMAQLMLPDQYSHSLKNLCILFNIDNKNAHRAMSDVRATYIVYNNLALMFNSKYKNASPNMIIHETQFT